MLIPKTELVPIERHFFEGSAGHVAPALLGEYLVRRMGTEFFGGLIVETEAYVQNDAACHANRGITNRNRVMFGPPGHAYVYFIYGCHFCVNAVCCPPHTAEAVLIRALEPRFGVELMKKHRGLDEPHRLTNGPGRLCQALAIGRELNGVDLCAADSGLYVARNFQKNAHLRQLGPILTGPRIGIRVAAELPLRFYLSRSRFVSVRHSGKGRPRVSGPNQITTKPTA